MTSRTFNLFSGLVVAMLMFAMLSKGFKKWAFIDLLLTIINLCLWLTREKA